MGILLTVFFYTHSLQKYSVYCQIPMSAVLTQLFTFVELFIGEMHKINSSLTVKNDNLGDNLTFAVMHLHSNKSSSGVQAVVSKIINSLSL